MYHLFTTQKLVTTQDATADGFIPEWAWELANERGLVIMLHMVLKRSLADVRNQQYIRSHCLKYPNAKLILAHAARGFCGYHGWSDWYLAANLSADGALDGHLMKGLSPNGVPRSLAGSIVPFTYNTLEELKKIVTEQGPRLAAIIMEPTRGVLPEGGFLEGVRQLADESGARLIFDEVTTGFRIHRVGAHLQFGVDPDVAVYAKTLGNGHPIAAIVGRAGTMEAAQESFISSTYWTEGVGPTAANATLKVLRSIDVAEHVRKIGVMAREGLAAIAEAHDVPLKISGHPALTYLGFADGQQSDAMMTLFTTRMLKAGYLCGGSFYPSLAHEPHHVEAFLGVADNVFAELGQATKRQDATERVGGKVKHSAFARLD